MEEHRVSELEWVWAGRMTTVRSAEQLLEDARQSVRQ